MKSVVKDQLWCVFSKTWGDLLCRRVDTDAPLFLDSWYAMRRPAAGLRFCLLPSPWYSPLGPSWLGVNCCFNAEWWSVQCKSTNVAVRMSKEAK